MSDNQIRWSPGVFIPKKKPGVKDPYNLQSPTQEQAHILKVMNKYRQNEMAINGHVNELLKKHGIHNLRRINRILERKYQLYITLLNHEP